MTYSLIYNSLPGHLISPLRALVAQITAVSPGFGRPFYIRVYMYISLKLKVEIFIIFYNKPNIP